MSIDTIQYRPTRLKRWETPRDYFGPEYPDHYVVAGQHRDSDALERSNFRSILRRLGGEENPNVLIARAGHWAVGWVETLLVLGSDAATLRTANDIVEKLDGYPVVDEDDFSALEWEERDPDEDEEAT